MAAYLQVCRIDMRESVDLIRASQEVERRDMQAQATVSLLHLILLACGIELGCYCAAQEASTSEAVRGDWLQVELQQHCATRIKMGAV